MFQQLRNNQPFFVFAVKIVPRCSEASDIYTGEEGKDLVSQSLQGKSEA